MKSFTCWLILLLGTGVSVVANIEHTASSLMWAKALAAVAPVFQALAVHVSQHMRRGWSAWLAWGVVGLCFIVSYESTAGVLTAWGWSFTQAHVYPIVPEVATVLAVLGLTEVTEDRQARRDADAQAVKDRQHADELRQKFVRDRPAASDTVSVINGERQEPSNPSEKRQSIVSRMDEKRQADVRMMANHWPGYAFLDIPEAERVRVVRRTLTTPEKTCGPDRAKRLVSIYMEYLESTLTNETQES